MKKSWIAFAEYVCYWFHLHTDFWFFDLTIGHGMYVFIEVYFTYLTARGTRLEDKIRSSREWGP